MPWSELGLNGYSDLGSNILVDMDLAPNSLILFDAFAKNL
jgi:hypothetical protein